MRGHLLPGPISQPQTANMCNAIHKKWHFRGHELKSFVLATLCWLALREKCCMGPLTFIHHFPPHAGSTRIKEIAQPLFTPNLCLFFPHMNGFHIKWMREAPLVHPLTRELMKTKDSKMTRGPLNTTL